MRDEVVGNKGSGEPAQSPETFQQDDETATQAGRCIFAHQRHRDRQLPAEAEADPEAADKQKWQIGRQRAKTGSGTVEHHGDSKNIAAAEAVSRPATQYRTKRHADEADADNPAGLLRVKLPFTCQGNEDKRHHAGIHRIKQPAQTNETEQAEMEAG